MEGSLVVFIFGLCAFCGERVEMLRLRLLPVRAMARSHRAVLHFFAFPLRLTGYSDVLRT